MTTSYRSRLGTAPEEAVKAPVAAISTENISLSGTPLLTLLDLTTYQTQVGDRVLVASQTNAAQNGIYDVQAGAWTRATDWNDSQDVVNGTLIAGTAGPYLVQATFTGDFEIDVTEVSFFYTSLSPTSTTDIDAVLAASAAAEAAEAAAAASEAAAAASAAAAAASAAAAATDAQNLTEGVRNVYTATASGGETSISPGFTVYQGQFDVYINGQQLLPGTDFTDADGTSIGGIAALTAGDEIEVIGWGLVAATSGLISTNNLSDLDDASVARDNLGLGSAAVQDDTYFLQVGNDLSDVADAATARTNLGLGDVAPTNASDGLTVDGTDLKVDVDGLGTATPVSTDSMLFYDASAMAIKKATIANVVGTTSGGVVLISTATASNSSEIDITLPTTGYSKFNLVMQDVVVSVDNVLLQARFSDDGGSTFKSGASDYRYFLGFGGGTMTQDANNADNMRLTFSGNNIGNAAGETVHIEFNIVATASATTRSQIYGNVSGYVAANSDFINILASAGANSAYTTNAIRLFLSSGNFTSGKFYLYGWKTS